MWVTTNHILFPKDVCVVQGFLEIIMRPIRMMLKRIFSHDVNSSNPWAWYMLPFVCALLNFFFQCCIVFWVQVFYQGAAFQPAALGGVGHHWAGLQAVERPVAVSPGPHYVGQSESVRWLVDATCSTLCIDWGEVFCLLPGVGPELPLLPHGAEPACRAAWGKKGAGVPGAPSPQLAPGIPGPANSQWWLVTLHVPLNISFRPSFIFPC